MREEFAITDDPSVAGGVFPADRDKVMPASRVYLVSLPFTSYAKQIIFTDASIRKLHMAGYMSFKDKCSTRKEGYRAMFILGKAKEQLPGSFQI
ncbi:hypothetical protein YWY31_44710 [Paenibacillus illinoisensis]